MSDDSIHLHQACFYPIESMSKLEELLSVIKAKFEWDRVGLFTDERAKNQIFLLFSDEYQASFRLNLSDEDFSNSLKLLAVNEKLEVRHLQGSNLKKAQLLSLESLLEVWDSCAGQSTQLTTEEVIDFIGRNQTQKLTKGRGKDFTKQTIEQVMRDSHGYCMFEGCGEKLDIDSLTGTEGNFSYLAHNVASSEAGPRGIAYLSEELSNVPENILLLCDKHHRLVDKVASVDYPASVLTQMRFAFRINVEKLLEGLSFHPIPVFSILWPVAGHVVSPPPTRDIAGSLSRLKARIIGSLNNLSSNDRRYITKPERFVEEIDEIVTEEANTIISQTKDYGYRAALFAFGPMPALVGLGASLGNKSEIIPMLRYRDGNCWMWPQDCRSEKAYVVNWCDDFRNSTEVSLLIALTQYPETMKTTAEILGHPKIEFVAKQMGNAAIPHPENGFELRTELHSVLQTLHDVHKIKRVHLLICASNAACVFVGQAFDLHLPELLVYDFEEKGMQPKLSIINRQGKVFLSKAEIK